MKIDIIDPTTEPRWDEFLLSQPHASVFHTSAWAKAIMEAYGYLPRYFVIEDQDAKYTAGIPFFLIRSRLTGTRLVCLPFSDHGYPLSNNDNNTAMLFDAVKNEMKAQEASYLEIRGWQPGVPSEDLGLLPFNYHLSHVIHLEEDIDTLAAKFRSNVRYSIRKAEKEKVTFRIAQGEEDLKIFYRFTVMTRKKNRVIPQPYSIFQSIYRNLILQGLGFLLIAEWQGKPIAASLFLTYKDTVYYKYNASDSRYLSKCPNHLLIWKVIQQAYDDGQTRFDFGRCNSEDEGLRTFKNKWAAEEIDLPVYYYPVVKGTMTYTETSLKYKMMNLAVRNMPNFLLTAIGSKLYKHLG